jgi:hypothetical protein
MPVKFVSFKRNMPRTSKESLHRWFHSLVIRRCILQLYPWAMHKAFVQSSQRRWRTRCSCHPLPKATPSWESSSINVCSYYYVHDMYILGKYRVYIMYMNVYIMYILCTYYVWFCIHSVYIMYLLCIYYKYIMYIFCNIMYVLYIYILYTGYVYHVCRCIHAYNVFKYACMYVCRYVGM